MSKIIPVLNSKLVAGTKWIFCIQKIIKYDDANEESYSDYIGAWDSDTGDIDKTMESIYNREKEFCDNNKFVKPFTFTLRKVAIECKMEVVDKIEDHFGNDYKQLQCNECGNIIQYGDDFVSDPLNEFVYCSTECFMKSHNISLHESWNKDYDSNFIK